MHAADLPGGEPPARRTCRPVEAHDLARLDVVAHVLRAHDVEAARLARHDPAAARRAARRYSGRMPFGSRNAYSESGLASTMAAAPSISSMARRMPLRRWCVACVTWPITFAATSLSVPERNCTPSSMRRVRKAFRVDERAVVRERDQHVVDGRDVRLRGRCGAAARGVARGPRPRKPSSAARLASSNTWVTRPGGLSTP